MFEVMMVELDSNKMYIYTDGGSRGNPGQSAIGVVICNGSKQVVHSYKQRIGYGTNNEAEYKALIKGLEIAVAFGKDDVVFFSDSELLIRQINGKYKIRSRNLIALYDEVRCREKSFKKVTYIHQRRENEFIQECDRLVNQALDGT